MISADVDIWTASLDAPSAGLNRLRAILDHDELERATRFQSLLSQRRFVAKHGIRRLLLAEYVGKRPQDIVFTIAPTGKPQVNGGGPLRFSDSVSGGLAVYAITADLDVGIDVEALRAIPDASAIVDRFGSPAERVEYHELGADREVAFLRWWTAKEAVVKAVGTGLREGLDGFSVSFPSDLPPARGEGRGGGIRLLEVSGAKDAAARFSLIELRPADGYVGTLVTIGRPAQTRLRQWSPSRRLVGGAV